MQVFTFVRKTTQSKGAYTAPLNTEQDVLDASMTSEKFNPRIQGQMLVKKKVVRNNYFCFSV